MHVLRGMWWSHWRSRRRRRRLRDVDEVCLKFMAGYDERSIPESVS